MKERILVMNGQRIVQNDSGGAWKNVKVDKAGEIKAGIYNIFAATRPNKFAKHDGNILHVDDKNVYQQNGKQTTKHLRSDFDILPKVGENKSISYSDEGRATVSANSNQQSKARSR